MIDDLDYFEEPEELDEYFSDDDASIDGCSLYIESEEEAFPQQPALETLACTSISL